MKIIIVWIKEPFLLANADFDLRWKGGGVLELSGWGVGGGGGRSVWGVGVGVSVRRRSSKQQHVEPASPTV